MSRQTRLFLYPDALVANARLARSLAPQSRLYAMVKADGYGHGLGMVARSLEDVVDGFGVALIEEALLLRQLGIQKPVMLLEGAFCDKELHIARQCHLELVVHADWQLRMLEENPQPLPVWIKVNTGMHRLGIAPHQLDDFLQRLCALSGMDVRGLLTHFACADEAGEVMTERQLRRITALAKAHGLSWSAANSAALLNYPDSHGDLVRPGIMLYGSSPMAHRSARDIGLSVTQSLVAPVIAIQSVAAGESVGYGATWTASRPGRVGVVAIGYGDGYPRHVPSGTPAGFRGTRVSLVGRVSMDMLTIDLTDHPEARVFDEVELWGHSVSVDEVAAAAGTISYELFCQVTARPEPVIRKQREE